MKKESLRNALSLDDVTSLKVDSSSRLLSATHEEILQGLTADVYFLRGLEALRGAGKARVPVVAEVFPSRSGVMAGVEELKILLRGKELDLWALPEKELFGPKEVVVRIHGPYEEFGLFETAILGILSSSSAWATAAKECKEAAGGKPLLCFGSRHIHPAVAPVMERSALLGGVDGASCILGAKLAGREPRGTMPHAYILIMGDTVLAARKYHEVIDREVPRVILVDTFKDEAEESLRVAGELGKDLFGVRLDTPSERGRVTPQLVQEVRARLDQAGYAHVKIYVSGGLDPERIRILSDAGADAFGVGSYISDASPIDMTLDLKEIEGSPRAKRGRIPGKLPAPRLQKV